MNVDQARALASALSIRLRDRNDQSQTYWDYYTGHHPAGWVQQKVSSRYGTLLRQSVSNFPLLIIDSVGDRMVVDGFRTESKSGDEWFSKLWHSCDMNVAAPMVQTDSLVTGYGYVSVWDDGDGVKIRGESSFEVIHERDPLDPLGAAYALKRWLDAVEGVWMGYLFTPTEAFVLLSKAEVMYDAWGNPFAEPPTGWVVTDVISHGIGVTPVVPFLNRARLTGTGYSEIGDVIPVFDRINTLVADMLIAAEVAAYRQRWATGMEIPKDEEGNPVEPFDAAIDRLWVSEDETTRFGQFDATELRNYTEAIDQSIQHVAAITRTPPFLLLGKITNLPLDLDTEVPTPEGMKVLGDITVGDEVFTPQGLPTRVVGLSPIYLDQDCYRITFDDGTEVVADGDHRWPVQRYVDPRKKYRVTDLEMTTRELAEGPLTRSNGFKENFNYYIPVAQAPDMAEVDLPIEPYTLGVWLGDGCSTSGTITSHRDDAPHMVAALEAVGNVVLSHSVAPGDPEESRVVLTISFDREMCGRGHRRAPGTKQKPARCRQCDHDYYSVRRDGGNWSALPARSFVAALKREGLWQNKHIPEEYFWASQKQRLALLQGLMDTDGTVNRQQGSVKLGLHNERLARDAHRLILSLGHKARLVVKTANHRKFGPATVYLVTWSALDPVFRLPRKVELQKIPVPSGRGGGTRPYRRAIVSVEPVESRPVRCLTVEDGQHQFCVTRSFVRTCNSADAMKATESGLVTKLRQRMGVLGESWERTAQYAARASGKSVGEVKVLWRDPENVSEAARVDALVKLYSIGLPWKAVMERWGATPDEIARWEQMRSADVLSRLVLESTRSAPGVEGGNQNGGDSQKSKQPEQEKAKAKTE